MVFKGFPYICSVIRNAVTERNYIKKHIIKKRCFFVQKKGQKTIEKSIMRAALENSAGTLAGCFGPRSAQFSALAGCFAGCQNKQKNNIVIFPL
jgi:hypothetical protein